MSERRDEVTRLLRALARGDEEALDQLFPVIYDDLRRIAHRRLQAERPGHTLHTTALVHEAYLRLVDQTRIDWKDRTHFFVVAAKVMRHILVDYARRRKAEKRGGGAAHVALQAGMAAEEPRFDDLLALHEALRALSERHERMGQVVECRFFGGLTVKETAEALDVSVRTVERDWTRAKAHLSRSLAPDANGRARRPPSGRAPGVEAERAGEDGESPPG